eukprot:6760016-Prorocentrum_lima.AAC.1
MYSSCAGLSTSMRVGSAAPGGRERAWRTHPSVVGTVATGSASLTDAGGLGTGASTARRASG